MSPKLYQIYILAPILFENLYFDPKLRFKTHNWIDPLIVGMVGTLGRPPPFHFLFKKLLNVLPVDIFCHL